MVYRLLQSKFVVRLFLYLLLIQSTSCYVLKQAYHQADLLSQRRGIKEVIEDTSTGVPIRDKLTFVLDLLDYARQHDLRVGGSYSHYIDLQQNVITYLVYAARKDSLELKKWWFPVVGTVPYLGYFSREDRDEKAASLRSEGYDVDIGGSIGISFLGWIVDPVYSTTINRTLPDLANVIFHELAHKTYWHAGDSEFNENLAEFVGVYLTKKFFLEKMPLQNLKEYTAKKRDRQIYKKWLAHLKTKLRLLYADRMNFDRQTLLLRKQAIIDAAQNRFKKLTLETDAYNYVGRRPWNNASIAGASLYLPKTDVFLKSYDCSGASSVGNFLKSLQKRVKRLKKGRIALQSFCSEG